MSVPRVQIGDRRGPGRPREFVDPSEITIRMEAEMHDRIIAEAEKQGISVGAAARALLASALNSVTGKLSTT